MIVERNVLAWLFDTRSGSCLTMANSFDLYVVALCQDGSMSSLAAASLQDLGLHAATDVIGGGVAWRAAGLEYVPGVRA